MVHSNFKLRRPAPWQTPAAMLWAAPRCGQREHERAVQMGRRTRSAAMAIAGLLVAVAPFVVTGDPAGAATSSAGADGSLTFARYGDGAAVTCTAGFTAQ